MKRWLAGSVFGVALAGCAQGGSDAGRVQIASLPQASTAADRTAPTPAGAPCTAITLPVDRAPLGDAAEELGSAPSGVPGTRAFVAATGSVIAAVLKTSSNKPGAYDLHVQLYAPGGEPKGGRIAIASGVTLAHHASEPFIVSGGGQFLVGWFVNVEYQGPQPLRFRWVSPSGTTGDEGSLPAPPEPEAPWSFAQRDDGVAIAWVDGHPDRQLHRAVVPTGATSATATPIAQAPFGFASPPSEAAAPDGGAWLAYATIEDGRIGAQFVLLRLDRKGNVVSRAARKNNDYGKSLAVTSDAGGPILAWSQGSLADVTAVNILRPDSSGRIDGPPRQQPIGTGLPHGLLWSTGGGSTADYLFGRHIFTAGQSDLPREIVPKDDWAAVIIPFQGATAVVSFAHPPSGREIHVVPTPCIR